MPYQDFRQFLDVLRQHGELIDVNRPVALNDVGKAMKQSYVRQGPAIMFNQNVTVASADSNLTCDRLLARLAAPLQIGQRLDPTATSFSQIDCEGQINIENVTRDLGGVTSHDRMQLGQECT